jgi:nucleoside-diphosphate-sugar epimerase/DNA-directed RNA polymerase specialized sigma24 family protein
VTTVRVFVAGGTGVIGRRLVPQLVTRGHQVTATTTSAAKLGLLEQLGADGVVMDGLDAISVGQAVAAAGPDAIVNQMTGLSEAHAGRPNLRKPGRFFAATNRLRSEGTDHLLAAAEATGVSHVVAQSFGAYNGIREGGWVKTEEEPLYTAAETKAIEHLEDVVLAAGGAVLRYGSFYGPGATDDQVTLVRRRLFPLVGGGTGYFSWVHLDDAASATVLAVEQEAKGVFNIVDDEPAPRQRVAALSGRLRGGQAPKAAPHVAGPAAGRTDGGGHDYRGARVLQRQGQAGARLGAALPVVAAGFQGRTRMTRAEEFEELRPLLFAIAYRILGSVAEAEDAVQEAWLRYEASPAQPTSAKAFLSAVVTRVSIDVLRSARVRREEYVGQWFPEPLLTDPYQDRERHMDAGRPRFEADRRERDELASRFFGAISDGDVEGLRELLAADVRLVGDGGGKAPALARSIIGTEKVARTLCSVFPWLVRIDVTLEPHEVNGQPGAIFRDRDGKVRFTVTLDVLDGQIQTIRSVSNPDKLRHVGPVADAWAIAREANRARRPAD